MRSTNSQSLKMLPTEQGKDSNFTTNSKLEVITQSTTSKAKKAPYLKSDKVKELEKLAFDYRKARFNDAVKKYYTDATASGLEKCIQIYTFLKGYHAEKVTSMGRQILTDGAPVFVRNSNTTGQADMSLIIKGRAVKIEVKNKFTGDHYQSQAQKKYQKRVENAGGLYVVIRDFAQFKQWLDTYVP